MQESSTQIALPICTEVFIEFAKGTKPEKLSDLFLKGDANNKSLIQAAYWYLRFNCPKVTDKFSDWSTKAPRQAIAFKDLREFNEVIATLKSNDLLSILEIPADKAIYEKHEIGKLYQKQKKIKNLFARYLCASRLHAFGFVYSAAQIYFEIINNTAVTDELKTYSCTAIIALINQDNYAKTCFAKLLFYYGPVIRLQDYEQALAALTNVDTTVSFFTLIENLLTSSITDSERDAEAVIALAKFYCKKFRDETHQPKPAKAMRLLYSKFVLTRTRDDDLFVFTSDARKKFVEVMKAIAKEHEKDPEVIYYRAQLHFAYGELLDTYQCIKKIKDVLCIRPNFLTDLANEIYHYNKIDDLKKRKYYRTLLELAVNFGSVQACHTLGEYYFSQGCDIDGLRLYTEAFKIAYLKCSEDDFLRAIDKLHDKMREFHPYVNDIERLRILCQRTGLKLKADEAATCATLNRSSQDNLHNSVAAHFVDNPNKDALEKLVNHYLSVNYVTVLCKDNNIETEKFDIAFKQLRNIATDDGRVIEIYRKQIFKDLDPFIKKGNLLAIALYLEKNKSTPRANEILSTLAQNVRASKLIHYFVMANSCDSFGVQKYPEIKVLFSFLSNENIKQQIPAGYRKFHIAVQIYDCLLNLQPNDLSRLKELRHAHKTIFRECTRILQNLFEINHAQSDAIASVESYLNHSSPSVSRKNLLVKDSPRDATTVAQKAIGSSSSNPQLASSPEAASAFNLLMQQREEEKRAKITALVQNADKDMLSRIEEVATSPSKDSLKKRVSSVPENIAFLGGGRSPSPDDGSRRGRSATTSLTPSHSKTIPGQGRRKKDTDETSDDETFTAAFSDGKDMN